MQSNKVTVRESANFDRKIFQKEFYLQVVEMDHRRHLNTAMGLQFCPIYCVMLPHCSNGQHLCSRNVST